MMEARIRGGLLVDGSGQPGRREDVAIRGGRFVPDDGTDADRTIDAGGLVVAPGFIDIHTHYDAQVFWDPMLSPSPNHGVTTLVAGNCGFTLAPMTAQHEEYIARMLARVEGMPYEALGSSVPWGWSNDADYLAALDRRGLGPNVGVMAGHSTIRRFVMGERAVGEEATNDEAAEMASQLDRALTEGALGFSTSHALTQPDADGKPVPSRWASREEILMLSARVQGHSGTMLQYSPPGDRFDDETVDTMIAMSLAADRPINWNLLIVGRYDADYCNHHLAASSRGQEAGSATSSRRPMRRTPVASSATSPHRRGVSRSTFSSTSRWPMTSRPASTPVPTTVATSDGRPGPAFARTRGCSWAGRMPAGTST